MARPATREPATPARMLTPTQARAQVRVLDGSPSRVARAALDDDTAAPDPTHTVGELWLYGVVGGWWRGFDAESVAEALRSMDVDVLYVRIHSPGGIAWDGVAIRNLLRNHRAHVVVVVDGIAASAASVIALAGDEIVMCPGSQMMLHDASTGVWGNEADLRRAADWIGGQSENYAGVYAFKAGGTPAAWREVMKAETWYTAEGAVAAGLADVVGNRVATGSPPTAPDSDDLDDDDTLARAAHDLQVLEHYVHPAARAAWRGEAAPKPPTASAGGSITTQEGSPAVAFSDEQVTTMRQKLGLAQDADETTIVAALDEALEERSDTAASTTPALKEGQIIVSQTQWDDLAQRAQLGVDAHTRLHHTERKSYLDSRRDRFLPTSRANWEKEYDLDPAGTRAYLDAAPVLVGTSFLGDGGETDTEKPTAVSEDPHYQTWRF